MTTSLDGYATDVNGNFDWAVPSEEVHMYVNDILRNVGTILMGRNLYDTMRVWDDIPTQGTGGPMDGPSPAMNDYAKIWRGAEKIVYSSSLDEVATKNTTIEHSFNPEAIKKIIATSTKDFDIGGPHLAAHAFAAEAIDELHQFIAPVMLGAGLHWLPTDSANGSLQLIDIHKFDNGFVHLHYRMHQ